MAARFFSIGTGLTWPWRVFNGWRHWPSCGSPCWPGGRPTGKKRRIQSPLRRASQLFPNTKLTEDGVEQIFGRGLADDLADGVGGDAQIEGDEFESFVRAQGLDGTLSGLAGTGQRFLMPRVDHDLQSFRVDLARPDELLDGVLQLLDTFAG